MEKGVLELCQSATTKPGQIEWSAFFYKDTTDEFEITDLPGVQDLFVFVDILIDSPGNKSKKKSVWQPSKFKMKDIIYINCKILRTFSKFYCNLLFRWNLC